MLTDVDCMLHTGRKEGGKMEGILGLWPALYSSYRILTVCSTCGGVCSTGPSLRTCGAAPTEWAAVPNLNPRGAAPGE